MKLPASGRTFLDTLAVVGPIICIIHCIGMPIVLAALPLLQTGTCMDCCTEKLIALPILAVCAVAILPGYVSHKRSSVLSLMLMGFAAILTSLFAEEQLGQFGHTVLAVIGSSFLITANLFNRKYSTSCCGEKHSESLATIPVVEPGN
jgi:hypothetical protein